MNTTDAIRAAMHDREESEALSLMEIQKMLYWEWRVVSTDSSIGRRLREMGAQCKRCRDGVFRYWTAQTPVQQTLLPIAEQNYRESR